MFTPTVEGYLRRSGALLFPRLPDLPFDPYRAQPYDAVELYGTGDYASSLDAVVYAWSHGQPIGSLAAELSTTLHDHSITDAFDDVTSDLEPRTIVGIMAVMPCYAATTPTARQAELAAILTTAGERCSPAWPGSDGGSKSRSVFESLAGITGRGIDHEAEPVVST